MIGSTKASAELGGIAFVLWGLAYGWYFWIGAGGVGKAFRDLLVRLRLRSPDDKPRPAAKQR